MKKIIFVGRSGSGKTTLTQALNHEKIEYKKTQYVAHSYLLVDTPGEYAQTRNLGAALAMYTFEVQVVGLVLSADEPYSIFSPCCAVLANRPVIGIVTKTDKSGANPKRAEYWLKLAGCEKVFFTSSYNGEGIDEILEYLK
ncbi:MAG: EutP/PduV family microcompartment system protein [Firmicutes bacterium]|nr:EutP/PduV family microcompartment system protein [Bacillota bacterium]